VVLWLFGIQNKVGLVRMPSVLFVEKQKLAQQI
jgi:hypothetical protein